MSDHDHDHDQPERDEHGHDELEHHEHDEHDHGHGEEHEHVHTFDWRAEVQSMRDEAAHFYVDHFDWRGHEAPAGFTGPKYFELSEDWRLMARLDRDADGAGDPVTLATSTGLLRQMQQAGDLVFEVGGTEYRLTAFLTQDSEGYDMLFVPFRDATSGMETYGAGRYIEAPYYEDTDEVELDFNLAYNPSCAFSPAYDCPYPPAQNRLPVEVLAGEKLPFAKPN
jgi:uncharacterized protein (DUF1684 family)